MKVSRSHPFLMDVIFCLIYCLQAIFNEDPKAGMAVALLGLQVCICGKVKDKTKQNCLSEQLIHCIVAKIKMIPTSYLLAN